MRTFFLLFCFISLFCFPVQANNCVLFTSERELPSNMVNQVLQDSDGVIWIATEDGLSRFDGADFMTFRKDDSDSIALINNYIELIYEVGDGKFIIGTLSGLQLYDHASRSFFDVPAYIDGVKFPQGMDISCIVCGSDSLVMIGTSGHGIFVLTNSGDSLSLVQDSELLPNCYYIEKIMLDRNKNLWVSTMNKGVFVLDSNRKIIGSYAFGGNESCFSFVDAPDGYVYMGTSQGNLLKCDVATGKLVTVASQRQVRSAIMDIRIADSTSLMLGTDGDGLKIFNTATGELFDYNLSLTGLNSRKLKVHSIMHDNRNNLWLGCFQQGVVLEPAAENEFVFAGSMSPIANTIGSCCVMSVLCDGNDIWVGTDNDGVYLLNKDLSQKKHFETGVSPSSIPRTTLCIFRDSRRNVWLGSYLGGLCRLNENTGRCEPVELADEGDFNHATSVYCIAEDGRQNLWVALNGIGFCRISILTSEQKLFPAMPSGVVYSDLANQLPLSWINTMLITGNRLYFGGYGGFGCLDIENEDFVSVLGSNRVLAGEVVYALHEGVDGKIWIGTANGLLSFDPQTCEIVKYTTLNGLPSNSISSIESDADGNLWISTNSGIACLNAQNYSFSNYYASDGLQCNEFSKSASGVNATGRLFFGGVNGLICFYPQKIKKHYSIPNIRLTNFYIHDKPVAKGMLSGGKQIVDSDISKAEHVYLSHSDNSFSIEFSAMEYANPSRITYLYNMDGKGWIHLHQGGNKVSFSNMKPGKHEFSVKAVDANSFSKTRKLIIHITAPWYATVVAYIVYFLLVAVVIIALIVHFHRNRILRMEVLEHKYAEDVNEAKLQFFINISHEIRTPMSLIIGPLRMLINSDADPVRQRTYDTIKRNAERILGLINQLMDIRKIDKGQMRLSFTECDIVKIVRDVCANFEYQANVQGISLNLVSSHPEIKAWVDAGNFDKIIVNILSNAFKHTPRNGVISVSISVNDDNQVDGGHAAGSVVIDIEDTGSGINPDELNKIFERFYQSQAEKTVSGTGVGLHLTKSLVELHHGTIVAANNVGKPGCHFTINLPIGPDHLTDDERSVMKPVLVDAKVNVLSVPQGNVPNYEPEPKKQTKTKYRVLIAEDDDEIRKYISDQLSLYFHVVECANGADALDSVLQNAPDVVVSDVMMPIMDGQTLCRKIKQNITVNYLPVILLTSLTADIDRIKGLDAGADAYLTKPFSIDVLQHTIMNLLRNRATLKNKFQGRQSQGADVKRIEVNSPDDRLMQRVMTVINKNLDNTELSVEMIASMVGISRVHLHRKLREITNQSARVFMRNVRLQQAATLLAEKRQSIAEIAEIVGFSSTSHFSTAFKDLYGVTPTEYMEKGRGEKDSVSQSDAE
ncbi:MAG: response regulator [Salinivirgaceae bacterium]|nr:response regulator [Salinivirgaceae bacterium]